MTRGERAAFDGVGRQAPICVFGAPMDTGNLGVSALSLSTLAALARRTALPTTVFDNGHGVRHERLTLPSGGAHDLVLRGAWHSRRWYRPESLRRMQFDVHRWGGRRNPNIQALDSAGLVVDISGGDSFSDIYGRKRFDQVTLPKRITLQLNRPLVLLPQTYGPYRAPRSRRIARRIVLQATSSWARDPDSHVHLQELLGDDFDPRRHRQGVDVAFTLPSRRPDTPIADHIEAWSAGELVGINVSGLLALGHTDVEARFALTVDYRLGMQRLVEQLLGLTSARILLVPHVLGNHAESDQTACRQLAQAVDHPDRVTVLPDGLGAMETKWVIARTSWFTGARMHATIAALSSGTPVTGVAYSDKIRGVFESCGVAHEVVDARRGSTDDFVHALLDGYARRDATRVQIAEHLPATVARCHEAFDDIFGTTREGAQ